MCERSSEEEQKKSSHLEEKKTEELRERKKTCLSIHSSVPSAVMFPRALLFDFDGVLLDTEWSIYQTLLEAVSYTHLTLPTILLV